MTTYDYQVKAEEIEQMELQLDSLTTKQLQEVAKTLETIKQSEEKTQMEHAKIYFTNAILPILQDYAEKTYSILQIDENKNDPSVEVILKNRRGFELTEHDPCIRSLFTLANYVEIGIEKEFLLLTFVFDYQKEKKL